MPEPPVRHLREPTVPEPGYNQGEAPGWVSLVLGSLVVLILILVVKSCL